MKRSLTFFMAGLVLGTAFLWLTRFQYFRVEHDSWKLVRVNRWTQQVCYSQKDGTWDSRLMAPEPNVIDQAIDPKYGLEPATRNACQKGWF